MAARYSRQRAARPSNGTPSASNSSRSQPMPTPKSGRPPERTSQSATCFAVVERRTLRDEADAGAEADARGERRGEGDRDERLDESDLAGEREAAVGGVWVVRGGRVEERHVLGEPERMKTGSLSDGRRGGNHVAEPRWIAGQREEESELHG